MKDFDYYDLQKRLEAITYIVEHAAIQITKEEALQNNLKLTEEELKEENVTVYFNYDNDLNLSLYWARLLFRKRFVSKSELLEEYNKIIAETVENKEKIIQKRKI